MKKTKDLNVLVIEAQPKLRDICILFRGISAQLVEFSQRFVEKFSQKSEDVALRFLTKLLGAMLLWKLNSKTVNTLRKSKLAKLLGKGLSILETMV